MTLKQVLKTTLTNLFSKRAILTKYAKEQGFRNIQYFVDDGYSGANFQRPDWQRMIELVEADQVGIPLAKDMSRIGGNYLEVDFYTEILFPKHDVASLLSIAVWTAPISRTMTLHRS